MISPCHNCTKRTAIPNCHADCAAYAEYDAYRKGVREKRNAVNEVRSMRVNRYIIKQQKNEKRT